MRGGGGTWTWEGRLVDKYSMGYMGGGVDVSLGRCVL